jgi:hypothetical protein
MINFVGDTSSGKSMTGNELIAAEYYNRKGKSFKHQYEDAEYGNKFDTTGMFGLDIMGKNTLANIPRKKYPSRPKTVQDVDARVSLFMKEIPENGYGIYFLDSLDAVTSEEMMKRSEKREADYKKKNDTDDPDEGKDKGTYGAQAAKFLSQEFFRVQGGKIEDRRIIIGIVSQVREVIGATKFQKKTRDSGGKAKGHWMSMKIWFTPKNYLYMPESKRAYGQRFHIKMDKTRDGKIQRDCIIVYDTGHGIDDVKTSLDFLFDTRTADKGGLKASAKTLDFNQFLKPTVMKKHEVDIQDTYEYGKLHHIIRKHKEFKAALDKAVIEKWQRLETESQSGIGSKYE